MSNEIAEGEWIRVFCSKSPGAFLNEYLISVDTQDGLISGFVDADVVEETEGGANYIWGIVQEIEEETVIVGLPGSFFTTTGIAYFSRRTLEHAL